MKVTLRSAGLALTLLALAAGSAAALVRNARAEAGLASGSERLLAGDATGALAALPAAASWPFTSARSAALAEQARVLRGEPFQAAAAAGGDADLEPLVWTALRLGRAEAALGFADALAARSDPRAVGARIAALVELGRLADARQALGDLAPALRAAGLAARALEALADGLEPEGAVVRDRRGRFVGIAAPDGGLVSTADARALFPWAALPPAMAGSPGLRLSLDLELSRLALDALGGRQGSIVLLDARRGDVLAAVSDERTSRHDPLAPLDERREPASIAKLVTAAAALRVGLDPDAEISTINCRGHERYGSGVLWCARPAGPLLGLAHALAVSCNVAFASLGERVGAEALLGELRLWGFGRADTGPFQFGRLLNPAPTARQLADLAIGLTELDVTPLHAALLAATVANGGVMPSPRLLAASDGRLGLTPRPLPAEPGTPVLDLRWLPLLEHALLAVTESGGTAEGLAPPEFPVFMKTGTAAEFRKGYHVNYVGAGPLPGANVAFCVRITYEPSSSAVNHAAHEATSRLLAGLGRQRWALRS